MKTINGKPSVYFTPSTLPSQPPTYETRIAETTAIAKEMADEEFTAKAEAEARHHTDCCICQAAFINWRTANPTSTEAETAHHEIWSKCPACVAEYTAWSEEVDRQAEARELERLGTGAAHCINGDDHRWQNGGVK